MKFSVRLQIALLLVLGVIACSRPVEETAPATSTQPSAETSTTSPPAAEQSDKTEAAAPGKAQDARSAPTPTQPPKVSSTPTASAARAAAPPAPVPEIVKIPAGTLLTVAMIDAVGTDTNHVGDTFAASIADPVIVDSKTILAKGMKVRGRVETLDEPGRVKGKAAISLVLTQLLGRDKTYAIATQPFTAEAESETKKNAVKVGGGAAIGAIVGAIAGGKKGAAVGAAVGGGAGTAAVLATKGEHIKIDSETKVQFLLKNDINVEVTKSTS
jgi:hypothetical protein